jgi:hypothetical protein
MSVKLFHLRTRDKQTKQSNNNQSINQNRKKKFPLFLSFRETMPRSSGPRASPHLCPSVPSSFQSFQLPGTPRTSFANPASGAFAPLPILFPPQARPRAVGPPSPSPSPLSWQPPQTPTCPSGRSHLWKRPASEGSSATPWALAGGCVVRFRRVGGWEKYGPGPQDDGLTKANTESKTPTKVQRAQTNVSPNGNSPIERDQNNGPT